MLDNSTEIYREADWRNNQPPRWWITAYAAQAENSNAHPRSTWFATGDYSQGRQPLIFVTPTLLGEGKAVRAKCAAVVLCYRLLSLVDCCAGRAGQRMQY
jgi:hypothetical protein